MKTALAFVGGMILGIAIAAAFFLLGSRPTSRKLDELNTIVAKQAKELVDQRSVIAEAKSAPHPSAAATPAPSAPLPAPTPEKPKNPLDGLSALMNNPAMRKMMATQQRRMIEENYADLIKQFQFTPEERAQFIDLLVTKQMVNMDFGMKVMKATPEEREALSDEMKHATENADDDLREFFNDDADYKTYEDYQKQLAQRMEIRQLAPEMAGINQPLSADQQKSLLEIMQAERKAAPASDDANDPTLGAEAIDRLIKRQAETQKRIAERAASILTTGQLEVLLKIQEKNLEMTKFGLEMSRSMFGTPAPTPRK